MSMSINVSMERPKAHILGGAVAGGVFLTAIAAATQRFGGPSHGLGNLAKVALAGTAAGAFAGSMTSVSPAMAGAGLLAITGMGTLAGHLNFGKGIIGRGNAEVATVMAAAGLVATMGSALAAGMHSSRTTLAHST